MFPLSTYSTSLLFVNNFILIPPREKKENGNSIIAAAEIKTLHFTFLERHSLIIQQLFGLFIRCPLGRYRPASGFPRCQRRRRSTAISSISFSLC
jgi:hypothetical protein